MGRHQMYTTKQFQDTKFTLGHSLFSSYIMEPSFFRIVITLPLNGAHQLEIGMILTPEADQTQPSMCKSLFYCRN